MAHSRLTFGYYLEYAKCMVWSANFAYAVGLITTDGYLSSDGRHIEFTSKDLLQVQAFVDILKLSNQITTKNSTYNPKGVYYRVQFGNVKLYRFLQGIGLSSNKSKALGELKIPRRYFADFLRGHLEGDGNISIAAHPESAHPQLRLRFSSASIKHLIWLKDQISQYFRIERGFILSPPVRAHYLVYAKEDSITLLKLVYYAGVKYYLERKYLTLQKLQGEW